MNREELKASAYADYAEKSASKEYPGVMMFYMTKENNLKTSVIPTNLTEEEFYQKLTDVELQEDFEGYIGEDAMKIRCTYHSSHKESPDADKVGPGFFPPPAVDRVLVNHKGQMFVSNGTSSTRVNYCPFTGEQAGSMLTRSEQEVDGKIVYRYD